MSVGFDYHRFETVEPTARTDRGSLEARERCARCGLLLLRRRGHSTIFATPRTPSSARSPILVRYSASAPPGCVMVRCERCERGGPHAQDCALRHPELAVLVPLLPRECQEDLLTLSWTRTREDGVLSLTGWLVGEGRTGFCNDWHEPGKRRYAAHYSAPVTGRGYHVLELGVWSPRVYHAPTRRGLLLALRARVPTRLVL